MTTCDTDRSAHRESLRRRLSDGLILISGGTEVPRNNDVNYVFRQRSNFLWLAGADEPGYHLLLDPKRRRDTLLIPKVDADHRVWLGNVPGPAETSRSLGIRDVRYTADAGAAIRRAARGYRAVYADRMTWRQFRPQLRGLRHRRREFWDALDALRAVKTPGELRCLARANAASAEGHRAAMAKARPGMREYEIQAEFEAATLRRGLRHQGYPPIVAAGANGAVLHYHRNDAPLKAGDLLLLDAGAECCGYSADITRTFPISGRFTRRQRDLYEIVLAAQKAVIERARPGVLSADLHVLSMRVIAEGLKSLGLATGAPDGLVASGAVKLFYPHGIGHMLGLDVHDCLGGGARQVPPPPYIRLRFNARLEPGFVITVEPGIYFNDALLGDRERRRKFRSQIAFSKVDRWLDFGGVRIEDDVVIRADGPPLNLTTVPKEIKDVEAACGG